MGQAGPGQGTASTTEDAWSDLVAGRLRTPSSVPDVPTGPAPGTPAPVPGVPVTVPAVELPPGALADLDHPRLVLTEAYVGPDRRADTVPGRLRRLVAARRGLLRAEVAVTLSLVLVAVTTLVLVAHRTPAGAGAPAPTRPAAGAVTDASGRSNAAAPHRTAPAVPVAAAAHPAPAAAATPTTTAPPVPTTTTTTTAPLPADPTPDQLGAAALALVRYPWRDLPGYSIVFLPIADAPSPSFYGNTSFTWGQPGGVSTLYVFPGETVPQLAGIIGFEIAHEVDAAAVEPAGGHQQIEDLLGLHPASWAPTCDCAEQGYLSGWYAEVFSNYWTPGVGAWTTLAPEPDGAELAALRPWLDPAVP